MSEEICKYHYTFSCTHNIATIYEDERIICKDILIEEKTLDKVIDKLNELSEENEQMKKEIERESFMLFKENMLLFRKILKVKEIVKEADCFSDEATQHDTIAYREMHKFDNKDAYAIASAFKKIKEVLRNE